MSGSLLRMRLLEPGGVTLFESLLTSIQTACSRRISKLFLRPLLLQTLLSHHVQFSFRGQCCAGRRFLSGLLAAFISSPFFRCRAVSRALCVEHRHSTHDQRYHSDQRSETDRLELSAHYTR